MFQCKKSKVVPIMANVSTNESVQRDIGSMLIMKAAASDEPILIIASKEQPVYQAI